MDLVLISGFLGAGKTTVLLHLARHLQAQGRSVAVLENEVGSTGVDDQHLRLAGLTVREILSGCICCSLRADLATTVQEIARDLRPDVLLVEPSGVAGPHLLLDALAGCTVPIRRRHLVLVVDAGRFARIEDLSPPVIALSLATAHQVLLNKVDALDAAALALVERRVGALAAPRRPRRIRADTGLGIAEACADLDTALAAPADPPAPTGGEAAPAAPGAIVVAYQRAGTRADDLGRRVQRLPGILATLAQDLHGRGCTLIGHIKAIVSAKPVGYQVFSITDFDQPVQVKGQPLADPDSAQVTLNAIVFGLPRPLVEERVRVAMNDLFDA